MSRYIKLAETFEIPKNEMEVFKVKEFEILVVNVEGEFYAFENRCPHMGYPLYFGSLEGKVITCGFHYARFDVTTGKSLNTVTDEPLRTLNIKVENSNVLVEL